MSLNDISATTSPAGQDARFFKTNKILFDAPKMSAVSSCCLSQVLLNTYYVFSGFFLGWIQEITVGCCLGQVIPNILVLGRYL